MNSIYQEILLDHYRHPHNHGRIAKPTGSVTVNNPLCGDVITMDIVMKDEKVIDVKFVGQGCAISLASASLLTDYARGKTKNELLKLDRAFIIKLLGVELGANRIKCALLPLETLHKLL